MRIRSCIKTMSRHSTFPTNMAEKMANLSLSYCTYINIYFCLKALLNNILIKQTKIIIVILLFYCLLIPTQYTAPMGKLKCTAPVTSSGLPPRSVVYHIWDYADQYIINPSHSVAKTLPALATCDCVLLLLHGAGLNANVRMHAHSGYSLIVFIYQVTAIFYTVYFYHVIF